MCQNGCNAAHAGNRNSNSIGVNSGEGFNVRCNTANFAIVAGPLVGSNFNEAKLETEKAIVTPFIRDNN